MQGPGLLPCFLPKQQTVVPNAEGLCLWPVIEENWQLAGMRPCPWHGVFASSSFCLNQMFVYTEVESDKGFSASSHPFPFFWPNYSPMLEMQKETCLSLSQEWINTETLNLMSMVWGNPYAFQPSPGIIRPLSWFQASAKPTEVMGNVYE